MFSLDNVVLPEKYLRFLAEYNDIYFKYGAVYKDILGKDNTTVFIIVGFLVVLLFKNSMEYRLIFFKRPYFYTIILAIVSFFTIAICQNIQNFYILIFKVSL